MSLSHVATKWSLRMGWRVFPTKDKRPLVKWKTEASSDPETIARMPWDDANGYGVALDPGMLVLDLDVAEDRDLAPALAVLREHLPFAVEAFKARRVFVVLTPSGGLHLYFRHDPDFDIPQSAWPHVDLRVGGKGYVIGPGSPGYEVVAWGESDIRLPNPLAVSPQVRIVPFLKARRA